MTTRYAWLQKHPTPAARAGEFHWYPPDGDRDVRASFAEHLPSATADIAMWQLAPDHAAWALPFVAIAPLDGRRYTGLALAIADRLGELVPPIAAPWTEATSRPAIASPPTLPDPAGVARALLDGGNAAVGDPTHVGLPRAVAAIERVMPAAVRVRRGTWTAGAGACAADRVAELAVAAATAPGSRPARAWQLARELVSPARDLDAVVAACVAVEPAWITTLNAWGRGKLARDLDELADRVALRALARLVADRDPAWAIAEARWHALLPVDRRTELFTAVARRADSLKAIIDEPGVPRRGSAAESQRGVPTSRACPGEAALPNGSGVPTSRACPGEAALPNGSGVPTSRACPGEAALPNGSGVPTSRACPGEAALPNGSGVPTSRACPGEAALPNGSGVPTSRACPGEAALPNGSAE